MNRLKNIFQFYRDCYQHDLKGIRVTNFISKSAKSRFSPTINEFFHNDIDKIHVDSDWAAEVEKELVLNHKEKALYAGTYFIKGNKSMLGNTSTNYLPLFIHELELSKINKVYFVELIDTYLNPDFITMMNSMDEELNLSAEVFDTNLPADPIGFEHLVQIENFFKEYCPDWNIDELFNYHDPKFNFSNHLLSLKKLKAGSKTIASGLIFGVFNKPQGSLGVLNELTTLADGKVNSPLLNQFFGLSDIHFQDLTKRRVYIPASLSSAQRNAIFKKDAYPISLVLGPPGTGKSFTIACLALDAICNNQSILIVSKNAQATRVVANVIEGHFGVKGKVVKADNQRYRNGLATRLSKMVNWSSSKIPDIIRTLKQIHSLQESLHITLKKIIEAEKKEIEWGQFYHNHQRGFFSIFKDKWIQYKKSRTAKVWKLNSSLVALHEQKSTAVKKYIKQKLEDKLRNTLKFQRASFTKLINALKEKNYSKVYEKIHTIDFELILGALPIWLTTSKQISGHLPLKKELFDVVIVDEASQCDISSMIPVIYRAKKLVVVGDPQQLNHVSFLSDAKQRDLRLNYGLDDSLPNYRTESLIDWTNNLITNQNQVTFLNEHYRSKPAIIRFSNERFYDNQLNLLRSHPINDQEQSVIICKTEGTRDEKGINEIEAQSIVNKLRDLFSQSSQHSSKVTPSIGISSPFSSQVSYIKTCVSKEFPNDVLRKHEVLIGTPFHFQGEERDIMLISFTLDSNSHFGAINYLNREDVFNVLITRARNTQYLFTSLDPKQLPSTSLLKDYLEFNHEYLESHEIAHGYDEFLNEVIGFLKGTSFEKVYSDISISGVQVDLTVVRDGTYYCIDLIGYPGNFAAQFSARNIEILNRMKTPVYFIPYSCWVLNKDQTKRELLRFLNS